MIFLFLIGTVLAKNLITKDHNYMSINCSQTFFDEASLNYMASFNFHSKLLDNSCPSAKAIAFKKSDLLEVEMKIEITNEIWRLLNENEKARLVSELRNRLHISCNSHIMPTELCRTNHSLDGGVYISTYDGSLLKHQFQKSCSVCLLKSNISGNVIISKSDLTNPIIAYLNLSVSDVVNVYDSIDDEIVSVKFIRSPDKSDLESQYLLKKIFGKVIINKSISLSSSLFYNIRVKLNSKKFMKKFQKGISNNSDTCIFRCDWSSTCLSDKNLICNNIKDCRYGDDENSFMCQIFLKVNINQKKEIKNHVSDYTKPIRDDFSPNKENIPLILSIILLTLAVISVAIILLVCFKFRSKHSNITKKQMAHNDYSHYHGDDPSFSSLYIHKSHFKEINGPLIINELLLDTQPKKEVHSEVCNSSIHKKMKNIQKKSKYLTSRYLKTNELDNNPQWDYNVFIKPNDLCSQINYPDSMTKSSWLRSYFQMTKIRNQMCVKAPLVVNISKLSPVSFSCNN